MLTKAGNANGNKGTRVDENRMPLLNRGLLLFHLFESLVRFFFGITPIRALGFTRLAKRIG